MKCPNCGAVGTLVYQNIQQCAYEHKILANGKISKRKKFVHIGPEEWGNISCTECGMYLCDQDRNSYHIEDNTIIIDKDFDEDFDEE